MSKNVITSAVLGSVIIVLLLGFFVYNPTGVQPKFYGTVTDYLSVSTIIIIYNDEAVARKECERLGFIIDNRRCSRQGKFLVLEMHGEIEIQKLVDLSTCKAITTIEPNYKVSIGEK